MPQKKKKKNLRKSVNKASTLCLAFGILQTLKATCPVIGCVRENDHIKSCSHLWISRKVCAP